MTIELRTVPREDLRKWLEAIETASRAGVSDEYWQYAENSMERDRTIGASTANRWSVVAPHSRSS